MTQHFILLIKHLFKYYIRVIKRSNRNGKVQGSRGKRTVIFRNFFEPRSPMNRGESVESNDRFAYELSNCSHRMRRNIVYERLIEYFISGQRVG